MPLMPPMLRSSKLPAILLAVTACRVAVTEEETIELQSQPLFYSATESFVSGSRVLQGSRACLEIESVFTGESWWVDGSFDQCYAITRNGEPFEDGSCATFDELGEVLFEYTPLDTCPFDDVVEQLVPDRYRLQVNAADGLRGRLEWWQERLAEIWLHPGPRGSFPNDWIPTIDEPLRLVPDVEVQFPIVLVDAAAEHVAWDFEQGQLLESRGGATPRQLPPSADDSAYALSIGPGERSSLALALPGIELPVAEVIATPVDDAVSLEIVVAYDQGSEQGPDEWGEPVAARALVRDAEGRVILGAPVEWTLVEGHLAVVPGTGDIVVGPPEYLNIGDDCEPPPSAPELRRATLRAELGTLVHEVELEWTVLPDEEPSEDPFAPNPACQRGGEADGLDDRGCGCAASGSRDTGWAMLGLVMLGALRRRRRARA